MKKLVAKTGFYLIIEKIARILLSFLVISIIAKTQSLATVGEFAYHMAIFSVLTVVVNFGTEQVIIFDTSKSNNQNEQINLINYLFLRLAIGVVSIVFLYIISTFGIIDYEYLTYFCLSIVIQSIYVVIPYYQGVLNYKKVSLTITCSLAFSFIFKMIILENFDHSYLPLIMTLDSFVIASSLLITCFLDDRVNLKAKDISFFAIKRIFYTSFPLFISALGIIIYSRSDQIIIRNILGEEQSGLYSSVIKLSEVFTFVIPIIVNLALTLASKFQEKDEAYYIKLFKLLVIYSFFCVLFITFFGKQLLIAVFTEEYVEVYLVLLVYSLSLLPIVIGSASNVWLIKHGLQKFKVVRVTLGVFLNIILNFILIPLYGLIGAAVATVLSQLISSFFANYLSEKTRPLFFLQIESLKVYKW
ncbi:polysaccharide biosynthesis C-terminal domain-containing protein [Vibrio alginolyticus]|uniref:oligosaccharide flippase family protein n=1 Tax=Vibrio alginolyticus TaxID=663 RepID=UPI004067CAAF